MGHSPKFLMSCIQPLFCFFFSQDLQTCDWPRNVPCNIQTHLNDAEAELENINIAIESKKVLVKLIFLQNQSHILSSSLLNTLRRQINVLVNGAHRFVWQTKKHSFSFATILLFCIIFCLALSSFLLLSPLLIILFYWYLILASN